MLRITPRSSVLRGTTKKSVRCVNSTAPTTAPKVVETTTTTSKPLIKRPSSSSASSSHLQKVTAQNQFNPFSGLELGSDESTIATRKNQPSGPNPDILDKLQLVRKWKWHRGNGKDRQRLYDLIQVVKKGNGIPARKEGKELTAKEKKIIIELQWGLDQYRIAKSYRQARSRLWKPQGLTEEGLNKLILEAEERQKAHPHSDREVQLEKVSETEMSQESQHQELQPDKVLETEMNHEAQQLSDEELESDNEIESDEVMETEMSLEAYQHLDREHRADKVLAEEWKKLTEQERKEEGIRVRFECIRRLGWRKGYSSGFPLTRKEKDNAEARVKILDDLRSSKQSTVRKASEELAIAEEEAAWSEWKRMDKQTRSEEEKLMWALRDRSMVYIDDSTASILGVSAIRWYDQPQKIGDMTFLPNDIVRLVRNNTPKNSKYDAFKATFRIPLSMHKHGLRSYLLAIYGLRTTWCRSSILRAPVKRSRIGQWRVGPASRTFKKVEVGLLEPFVFPEISTKFLKEVLMQDEMKSEFSNLYLKISGKRRWRRSKLVMKERVVDPNEASIDDDTITTKYDGYNYTSIPARKDLKKKERESSSTIWNAYRTHKRSSILKLVHQERLAKEAQIAQRAEELK